MNLVVNRLMTLLVAAVCMAVLMLAPFVCAAEACVDASELTCSNCAACSVGSHDDGPQATVKPLAALPAAPPAAVNTYADAGSADVPLLGDEPVPEATRPLRI